MHANEHTYGAPAAPVRELVLLTEQDERLEDQRLFLNLAAAYGLLRELAEQVRPEALATLAYEGGHPDHDSCSVLGARLGEHLSLPVWEAPLYSRFQRFKVSTFQGFQDESEPKAAAGSNALPPTLAAQRQRVEGGAPGVEDSAPEPEMRGQEFVRENGTEAQVEITEAELACKRAMCAEYASQGDILRVFDARREVVRPQVSYDYARRPHAGPVNYECWQWWMRAEEVSAKFAEFVESGQ